MSTEVWAIVGGVATVVFGGGGLATLAKVMADRKVGVKGEERATRRDMIADRDGLIQTLLTRQGVLEARVTNVEDRNAWLDRWNGALLDHVDVLEALVYAVHRGEAQPPPPPRPVPPPRKDPET